MPVGCFCDYLHIYSSFLHVPASRDPVFLHYSVLFGATLPSICERDSFTQCWEMSLALFLAGTGLKIVVKSHFLNIRVIYTPEQHPMGFSVPRTQAKAVRGVKDKKAGKNCFPQRIFLDHLLTECTQTSVSQLLTDSPQASSVFPRCAAKQSLQALL